MSQEGVYEAIGETEDAVWAAQEGIAMMLEMYLEVFYTCWESAQEGFNPGQIAIYFQHLVDIIAEASDLAANDWPWTSPDDSSSMIREGYDQEVTDRAFGDTIEQPNDRMEEIVSMAQAMDFVMNTLIDWLMELYSRLT